MKPLRIVHVTTGVGIGGAELTLYRLLRHADRERFEFHVVSLLPSDVVGERIAALGIPLHSLGMRRDRPDPWALAVLVRRLRALRPDVVQTWMYHADFLGGLAAYAARVPRIVWTIHHASVDPPGLKRRTRAVARTCAVLSRVLPSSIVCCSRAGQDAHAALGYASDRMVFVPNGYDTLEFRPDPSARRSLRAQLRVAPEAPLVGMIARFDPQKDHAGLLAAARTCVAAVPDLHFVLCGEGVTPGNPSLIADATDVRDNVHLLGPRPDVANVMGALDVGVLSSRSEAFPNAVAETMACGVPCVVTDVGDAGRIVGDTGRVVPPGDPGALAAAILGLWHLPPEARGALGHRARERVRSLFGVDRMVDAYRAVWEGSSVTSSPIDDNESTTARHTASRS